MQLILICVKKRAVLMFEVKELTFELIYNMQEWWQIVKGSKGKDKVEEIEESNEDEELKALQREQNHN